MAQTRFKLNHSGMARLLKSSQARQALEPAAQNALTRQQSTCPRDTGTLAGSLEVWDDTTDRAVKRVGSRTVSYAAEVEADTGFMARSL